MNKGLSQSMLNAEFFREVLSGSADFAEPLVVLDFRALSLDTSAGNTVALSQETSSLVGHFPYEISWKSGSKSGKTSVVVKSKGNSRELVLGMRGYYAKAGAQLAESFDKATPIVHAKTHIREPSIYGEIQNPLFKKITPKVYKAICDEKRELYVIVMELFEDAVQLNTKDPSQWNADQIKIVMRDMGEFHSIFLGATDSLEKRPWCDSFQSINLPGVVEHWGQVLDYLARNLSEIVTPDRVTFLKEALRGYPEYLRAMQQAPATLIHNNFSPRNMYLKTVPNGFQTKVYDWDTAWIHVPQRDICEFLAWVVAPTAGFDEMTKYIEHYRQSLEKHSGRSFPKKDFYEIYTYACIDYIFSKMFTAGVLHLNFKKYPSLARRFDLHLSVINSLRKM